MPRYAMAIDLSRCTGCRACMEACKVENNTSEAHFWMYVFRFEEGEYPDTKIWFMPRPCMHCENPPCVKVCPVGARYAREDGIVVTDWQRCIGCRYCEVACPYGVNYFNWKEPSGSFYLDWGAEEVSPVIDGAVPPYKNPDLDIPHGDEQRFIAGGGHYKGVMGKCTFCIQRVEKGLTTACADSCPTNAIIFGDLDDPESEVSAALRENVHHRLLEEVGTRPRVYYIGGKSPGIESRQVEVPMGRIGL